MDPLFYFAVALCIVSAWFGEFRFIKKRNMEKNKLEIFGNSLAILASMTAAMFFIPYKMAVQTVTPDVFTMGIFFVSLLMNIIPVSFHVKKISLDKTLLIGALIFAILTVAGNYALGKTLEYLNSPLTVVVLRMQVLFVMLAGWVIFKEKISGYLWFGCIFSLAGIFVTTYSEEGWQILKWSGILWGLFSMLSFGLINILIKSVVNKTNPIMLNFLRMFFTILLIAVIPGRVQSLFNLSGYQWWLISVSAFFGPMASRILGIYSLKYIPISRFIIYTMLTPVFTLFLSWIIIGTLPSLYETIGGIIIISGILIPLLLKNNKPVEHHRSRT